MSALAAPRPASAAAWLQPLRSWPHSLRAQLRHHDAVVRVLVAGKRGSAPREIGACMLVSPDALLGSIGGGHLEWRALDAARTLLHGREALRVERFILGAELAQCCGGVVELWLERWSRAELPLLQRLCEALDRDQALHLVSEPDGRGAVHRALTSAAANGAGAVVRLEGAAGRPRLSERLASDEAPAWLFGAGHVGQALARLLAELPFRLHWVDARAELFPPEVPDHVRLRATAPLEALRAAGPGARYIVMTHDHTLDYALIGAILRRGDARYLGLIGSDSKAARFRSRLARDGFTPEQLATLVCPVGVPGIPSKLPAAIAVSIAAQVLQTLDADTAAPSPSPPSTAADDCGKNGCSSCPKQSR